MTVSNEIPRYLRDAAIVAEIRRRGPGWTSATCAEAGIPRNSLSTGSVYMWTPEDELRLEHAFSVLVSRLGLLRARRTKR